MLNLFLSFLMPVLIPPAKEGTPNRMPHLAASDGVIALVYGSGRAILSAHSVDRGATFSKPVVVAELPVLPLTRHRGPRPVLIGRTMLVSAIGGKTVAAGPHAHGLPADGDLFVWRSEDLGKTWSEGVRINDVPGAAREGLHAFAADAQGNVAVVWLDLRETGTRLFGSYSKDAGRTWSKNVLVYQSPDGTICQCCHPSLLALGNGEFAVMFRNAVGGARDMYLARFRDGKASAAEKLGSGRWEINACPMDGGGLALVDGKVASAWRRAEDLFVALPGVEEKKVGTGKDIAFAARGGRLYATWTAAGGKIEAWHNGKTEPLNEGGGGFSDVVALANGGALVAWEENGSIAVRRLE